MSTKAYWKALRKIGAVLGSILIVIFAAWHHNWLAVLGWLCVTLSDIKDLVVYAAE